jgi:hypothetical protein
MSMNKKELDLHDRKYKNRLNENKNKIQSSRESGICKPMAAFPARLVAYHYASQKGQLSS